MNQTPSDVLGANGIFAESIEGFRQRDSQISLSESIATCIENQGNLLAEAGTGTGKTFAYLVPAILSEKKVLISTGTKALQDQLFFQDLPAVAKRILPRLKVALLKGRSNYLCHLRLEQTKESGRLPSQKLVGDLKKIIQWSAKTKFGDIAEVAAIDESSEIWPLVTSTNDNCQGADCPYFEDCHLVKARRRSLEADVVVVNHHLFFADVALKEVGFGEILPSRDVFIFDEAHQLAGAGYQYFGSSFTSRKVNELIKDVTVEYHTVAKDSKVLLDCAEQLTQSMLDCRLAMPDWMQKDDFDVLVRNHDFQQKIQRVSEILDALHQVLTEQQERSTGLTQCHERCEEIIVSLQTIMGAQLQDQVKWFESYKRGFGLFLTPLSIAKPFSEHRDKLKASWIFTSATLAVNEQFSHVKHELGIEQAQEMILEAPFDYASQGLLYIPRYMPDPNSDQYMQRLYDEILPIITASKGRAFILFTSYKAMHWFADELTRTKFEYPVLVQGDGSKIQLLQWFKKKKNCVLLGTASFWEGVDVKGDALSLVVIDKLPFGSPGDPILKAKTKSLRAQGKDPFYELQMQQAALMLKQGAGRLIRDEEDSGVLMICDPRIIAREYGQVFVQSLPGLKRTRNQATVCQFFENK
jgi:ATP-dependent DNA helicase DinG